MSLVRRYVRRSHYLTLHSYPQGGRLERWWHFLRKGLNVHACVTLVTLTPPRAVFVFECDVTSDTVCTCLSALCAARSLVV